MANLRLLHTSDWHLGRRLYGHTRYEEFSAFLDWLYNCIVEQSIDVLIVAGDIFDSMTPSNKAQALYYEFLGRVSHSSCQHVIIVAGNHDSPSLLDAPKEVLKFLNVHIIGTACQNIEDEVITLSNNNGEPQAIILAVPYLRDKDVRQSLSAESSSDKNSQLIAGIKAHYQQATEIAKQRQKAFAKQSPSFTIPIIATGHLFATGGKTTSDDGVRDLYVGSLGQVGADAFDADISYVALGHLHVPQKVAGKEHIRYSGSPIAMGFGEAKQQKQVLLVEFESATASPPSSSLLDNDDKNPTNSKPISIQAINVPCFHKLAQITGDLEHIKQQIDALKNDNKAVWVEVIYQSDEIISNLTEQLAEMIKDSKVDIIKIKNSQTYQRVLKQSEQSESLHDLSKDEVFSRCLDIHKVAENQRDDLMACFQQIVYEIEHEDVRAE